MGFSNLFQREAAGWWQTRRWLVQLLTWAVIINGFLSVVLFLLPRSNSSDGSPVPLAQWLAEFPEAFLLYFFYIGGMGMAVGAILCGQEALLDERKLGMAAWILTKPISRAAYVLAKAAAHTLGILLTIVVAQGAIAFCLYRAAGADFSPGNFAAALGLLFLYQVFFLCLAMLMGVVIHSRIAGLGIALALNFGCHFFLRYLPCSMYVFPWGMIYEYETGAPPQMVALAMGQPLTNLPAVIFTMVWIVVLLSLTVWRVQCEEF